MPKGSINNNRNKEAFKFDRSFMEFTKEDRLKKIHVHPSNFKRELETRERMIKEIVLEQLGCNLDGFSKQAGMDSIKSSNRQISDVTATTAERRLFYESILSSKEEDIKRLLYWNEEDMPREVKMYIILKNSWYLYNKVLELFPEDTEGVLSLRAEGLTYEKIAEELDRSVTYVTNRITTGYELIDEKSEELIGIIYG